MNESADDPSRLDQIQTRWSLICRSGDQLSSEAGMALHALTLRYAPAIRRYVFAITRDDDLADELSQDIVVRLLKGELLKVDAEKGRFRDFLKVVIRNTVRNRWSKDSRRSTAALPSDEQAVAPEDDDATWEDTVRQHVLSSAWHELERYEQQHAGSLVHTVLRLRVDQPEASSEDLARLVSEQVGREINAAALRQQLSRARKQMRQYVISEVSDGLREPDPDQVDEELARLGLKSWVDA